MEGPPLGPGGEDITWPNQVAPRGRKASSTRKIKPQTPNLMPPPRRAKPVKVVPWVVDGAGGLRAGKTGGADTRGVDLNAAVGGRTGYTDTNGGESSNNGGKIHADCYPAKNPSL